MITPCCTKFAGFEAIAVFVTPVSAFVNYSQTYLDTIWVLLKQKWPNTNNIKLDMQVDHKLFFPHATYIEYTWSDRQLLDFATI